MSNLVPTKRLWSLLALGLVLVLGGAWVPGLEWWIVPYDILLFILYIVTGRTAASWNAIQVARRFESVLSVRQANRVVLDVQSSAPIPLQVQVIDEAPTNCRAAGNEFSVSLRPGETKRHEYDVTPMERGSDAFVATHVRFRAPLGLAYVQQRLETYSPTKVYPNLRAVHDFELLKQRGRLKDAGLRRSNSKGLGTEFESLREYNGDDFRFIDWKSTARRGRLVVRNYEQERNQALFIVLDLGRHMLGEVEGATKLDHSLDAALLLFHAAERAGDMVGLYAFDDAVRAYVAPKRGRAQVAAVLAAAHNLQPEAVQPNYTKAFTYLAGKWKRRALVVVFTDAENEDQAHELVEALGPIRRHHLLLVVRVKDPRMDEVLNGAVDSQRSLFTKAAATLDKTERNRSGSILAAAGVSTIESEPQNLSAELVSTYLRVKERAML